MAEPPPVVGDALPSALTGRFEVSRAVGRGGFATVYDARERAGGRRVALKVLAPELGLDPTLRERFAREASLARRVRHPALVPILDAGEDGGRLWLAMEFVEGRTLRSVLDGQGPLPWREALRLAASVAEALGALHAAGAVHRDVKPDNVMLEPGGAVRLLDLGIARALDEQRRLTSTGAILGTMSYLAPEVCRGERATAASDVYAVGLIVFEALGDRSFAFTNTESPVDFLSRRSGVMKRLAPAVTMPPAVRRALAAVVDGDPAARPPDGAALARVLTLLAAAADEAPDLEPTVAASSPALLPPSPAPEPPTPDPVPRGPRRQRVTSVLRPAGPRAAAAPAPATPRRWWPAATAAALAVIVLATWGLGPRGAPKAEQPAATGGRAPRPVDPVAARQRYREDLQRLARDGWSAKVHARLVPPPEGVPPREALLHVAGAVNDLLPRLPDLNDRSQFNTIDDAFAALATVACDLTTSPGLDDFAVPEPFACAEAEQRFLFRLKRQEARVLARDPRLNFTEDYLETVSAHPNIRGLDQRLERCWTEREKRRPLHPTQSLLRAYACSVSYGFLGWQDHALPVLEATLPAVAAAAGTPPALHTPPGRLLLSCLALKAFLLGGLQRTDELTRFVDERLGPLLRACPEPAVTLSFFLCLNRGLVFLDTVDLRVDGPRNEEAWARVRRALELAPPGEERESALARLAHLTKLSPQDAVRREAVLAAAAAPGRTAK